MTPFSPLTWPAFTAQSTGPWQPLAQLARTFYAQQGRLVTAAQYLAMAPAAAAEPFLSNVAAQQLVIGALPAAGPAGETYAQFMARGQVGSQPLLAALVKTLAARGVAPAEFTQALATQGAESYLPTLLGPDYWAAAVGAAQRRVQRQLDDAGRVARLEDAQPDAGLRAAWSATYARLAAIRPDDSLESLAALPSNELARALWNPAPAADDPALTRVLDVLQATARRVMDQNYPDAELITRLLAATAPELQDGARALLLAPTGTAPLTSVTELATADGAGLAARVAALPANHPYVYAQAAWVQGIIQRFLRAQAPASVAVPASPLLARGRLLGAGEIPLANFTLRPMQTLASRAGAERTLGELRTGADGRFALLVPRDLYLDEDDAVAEAVPSLHVAVYRPGQDLASAPVLSLILAPTADDESEQTLSTDLPLAVAAPASVAVASLRGELPDSLATLLASNNILSLSDVRAAGGVQRLAAALGDAVATVAARRLDGLAQLEVVSGDTDFHEQVVAAGFYSPSELVDAISPTEFVRRLAGADGSDAQRAQAAAFYQQAAAVQALSQTLGLLSTGAQASGAEPASTAAFAGESADASNATAAPEFSGSSRTLSARRAFTTTATDDTTTDETATDDPGAQTSLQRLSGHTTAPVFNPAPAGKRLFYDSSQQCDCPACRSAVSPTAYLAALLKYATTNLSQNGQRPGLHALQDQFQQPFADLRVSCQAASEQVCQYRLAIEVIQAYASRVRGLTPLRLAEARPYVEAMLDALLQALGTSLDELRATPSAQLAALAGRLAVPVATLDELRTSFSVARLADDRPLDAIEADLERCFGLVSTARDPLTTGLLLGANDGNPRLVRWSLDGLEWGVNTGPDGRLHLEVIPAGAPDFNLNAVVYKGGTAPDETDKTEDNVVARGTLSATSNDGVPAGTYQFAAVLYSQHGSGLRGSVVVQTRPDAGLPADTTFTLGVVPALTAGQQQVLFDGWLSQDAAASELLRAHDSVSWNGFSFLVDPDLLGPDDFRPLQVGAADLGNEAYRIWRRRYEFLQDQLVPQLLNSATAATSTDLGALIDALNQRPITYVAEGGAVASLVPWRRGSQQSADPGTTVLARLSAALAGPTTELATQQAPQVAASLGLSPEAVQRLCELWQLSTAQPLLDAELQEALDLVRQSVKKALEGSWTAEETANGPVELATALFQQALHEPQAGSWQQLRPAEFGLAAGALPRVDPDEVTPLDLPDAGRGDLAATLWSARQAELLRKRQAVLASEASATTPAGRAAAMLAYAYRSNPALPTTGLPGTAPYATLELVWAAYQNEADPQHVAATAYFAQTLALRPAEAERLLALRALVATQATDATWQEMAALLALGWKRAVAYQRAYVVEGDTAAGSSWLAQEAKTYGSQPALDYLIGTRKHRLVKWRADADTRATWVQALALATQRPLIDPDQLVPGDFRQAGERSRNVYEPAVADADRPYLNPAYGLFAQRTAQVQGWFAEFQTSWPTGTADQWQVVTGTLGSTQPELEELYRQLHAGVDVSAALRRLTLSSAGLELLVGQLTDPAATDRLTELHHLLVQVRRGRAFAGWAREEIALELNPSPRYFRAPQAEAVSLATLPWRSSATARRQWQRRLRARFAQAAALTAARQQAVRSAEDQYLPLLRDALLTYKVEPAPAGFDTQADWLSSTYLLDFKTACCQHTTRVAQGIEVLQKLFVNLRGGLPSNDLVLDSSDTTFEQDWQWLGSYERWRSLLFLYLYPQNVLLPALKPGQSSQFRQTVSDIRQAASTSPAAATAYLTAYQVYLQELGSIQVVSSVQTYLENTQQVGLSALINRVGVSLQAGLSATNTAYVNLCYLQGEGGATDPASYNWQAVPGSKPIDRIVGMAAYRTPTGQRYVYLFGFLRGELVPAKDYSPSYYPLTFATQRFNLATLAWDADYLELPLPGTDDVEPHSVRIAAAENESWAPIITGLRNRRSPLITEAPLSLPAVSGYASQTLTSLLGEQADNVDLFFCKLDLDGKKLGVYLSKTIFLVNELDILSCVRVEEPVLFYLLGSRLGLQEDYNLKQLKIELYGFTVSGDYIVDRQIAGTNLQYSNNQTVAATPTVGTNAPAALANLVRARLTELVLTYQQSTTSTDRKVYGFIQITNPIFHQDATGGYFAGNPFHLDGFTGQDYTNFKLTSRQGSNNQPVIPVGIRLLTHRGTTDPTDFYYFTHAHDTYEFAFNTGSDLPSLDFSAGGTLLPSVTQTLVLTLEYPMGAILEATPGETDPATFVGNGTAKLMPLPARYTYLGPSVYTPRSSTQSSASPYAVKVVNNVVGNTVQRRTTVLDGTIERILHEPLPVLPSLFSSLTPADLDSRRTVLGAITNLNAPGFVNNLVSEGYYALPMLLAQELMRSRNYELALHYFRLVYDYTKLATPTATLDSKRLVYPALVDPTTTATYDTALAWLNNPNNPYTLAALRPDAHLQYVVMSIVRCLLAYADNEFTTDTAESVPRARSLYELAARLLKQDITQYAVQDSASLLDPIDATIPADWLAEWQALKSVLAGVNQRAVLDEVMRLAVVEGAADRGLVWLFAQANAGSKTWAEAFNQAWELVNSQLSNLSYGYLTLGASQDSALPTGTAGVPLPGVVTTRPYVPFLGANFCVPTNPVPFALALQAELNLFKIRSCRNIAGVQREIDPYAAATDNATGLATLSSTGQLVRSARMVMPATQYRYAYVIERARQIVALAQQTEGALLSALEKRDAEAYNQLKARQDIAVSQATVQLQTLRVTEAEDGVDLAGLQLERSEISERQYYNWLDDGLNGWEIAQLVAIGVAGVARTLAATSSGASLIGEFLSNGSQGAMAAANAVAAIADATAQISGLKASYDRRAQEWEFQKTLSAQDIKINQQQIRIANDQVRITGQEKQISQLQLDHAQSVLDFLTTKFTNAELYDWMSRILENAYGYFLQQATATARLAEQQLAFERQQAPAGIIQADYYSDPTDDASSLTTAASTSTSRMGLTGSVRLLQDLTRLDEYAFETNQRKLQLSKTISLAQSFPTEFVRFRETGVVAFACQPEWFDQDFPGQYLRVVRRVRTSVIALVPPVDSIKARLSTAGTSHVTVDGTPFQTLALPRAQEAVALTSPTNATGLYELDAQNDLLLPFEGLGVDVPWTFSMQPASNPGLDYSAVADVLITLDYSALDSADYARQVVQQLGTNRRQVVALSFRDRFADQWYDLAHAADLDPAAQYVAAFTVAAADLPLNLRHLSLSQVSLFVDAPLDGDATASGAFTDRSHLEVRLTRGAGTGGSAFTNQYGLISTRTGTGAGPLYTGNASSFLPLIGGTPTGDWTLAIAPGRLRERLAAGLVNDIYLILEVEGDAPAYVL